MVFIDYRMDRITKRDVRLLKNVQVLTKGMDFDFLSHFMLLVSIAIVIGVPIAWYITRNYLADYAYRINLGWQIFAGVALLVCLVAVLTVCGQSLRAATANPIKAIKTE